MTDRKRFQQIVTDVLAGSLDLFITPCDEREELRRLRASPDRLLTNGTPALGALAFGAIDGKID